MKDTNLQENQNRARVVSLGVNVCNHDSVIEKVSGLIEQGNGGYVCFSTVHMVMESYDDSVYGAKINDADLIIPDGMPLVWMQKLQGITNAARVRANDLMIMLCDFAEKNNLKVGFYGGTQNVIDEITKRAAKDFPKLQIAYAFSPPFRALTEAEDAEVVKNIEKAGVQILFVGLGCPKQENWMARHKNKTSAVMLGVGASFDFYAGNIKESPRWLGNLGLEWFYRLLQEPKRLWRRYLILNPRFMWLATMQLLGLKRFSLIETKGDREKQFRTL